MNRLNILLDRQSRGCAGWAPGAQARGTPQKGRGHSLKARSPLPFSGFPLALPFPLIPTPNCAPKAC